MTNDSPNCHGHNLDSGSAVKHVCTSLCTAVATCFCRQIGTGRLVTDEHTAAAIAAQYDGLAR